MTRPKDIGTKAETAVVRYLRSAGFPQAERRALRGTQDAGDITGIPGVCIEVKGGDRAKSASDGQIAAWLAETATEAINADADLGVLVVSRRGVGLGNAHRWWAVVYGDDVSMDLPPREPVRMYLSTVASWLVRLGYHGEARP